MTADLLNQDLNLVANLKYLLGMLYAAPGHFGNMKQTVCSAKVNKCTEIGNVLNGTFHDVAFFDTRE